MRNQTRLNEPHQNAKRSFEAKKNNKQLASRNHFLGPEATEVVGCWNLYTSQHIILYTTNVGAQNQIHKAGVSN